MLIRILDLETTGFEEMTCGVVEIGAYDLSWGVDDWVLNKFDETLVNPEMTIPPAASSCHHLIDADVQTARTWDLVLPEYLSGADVLCAHNAKFEQQWIKSDKPWICTWKAALTCFPEAPGFSNQELRYWLNPPGLSRTVANVAHRASPDAYVTAFLLRECLRTKTVAELIDISSRPALLTKVSFGKHRGAQWKDVERGYLSWVVKQGDMDENVLYTARHWLNGGRA